MSYGTLISSNDLAQHLDDPSWLVVDCRFSLAAPSQGWQDYQAGHIPGAVYAHLDEDLCAPRSDSQPVTPVKAIDQSLCGGRHPLPSIEYAAQVFGRLGIERNLQVVAYDAAGGAMVAARLWWLLRWLGHTCCAVLDGGWQHWLSEDRPVRSGPETPRPKSFSPKPRMELIVGPHQVEAMRHNGAYRVLDARAFERYQGKNETIDPVAGHIPGARSAPYQDNLTPDLCFRTKTELHRHYQDILENVPAERSAVYCGSGVTAAHNILAMLYAGLGEARLYAGSWSEWITDPSRPVASS
jgi:thiosulfate/3-mercaptopyruvate sulfurtransferase